MLEDRCGKSKKQKARYESEETTQHMQSDLFGVSVVSLA